MTNPFTNLEIQLIRAKLDTHSDGELAAILERPIEEVHEFIDMMTVGGADARSGLVQELKEKQHQEKVELGKCRPKREGRAGCNSEAREARIRERKEMLKVREERKQKEFRDRSDAIFREAQRKKEVAAMAVNRKFKTRQVDYSKMKSVKVAKGTYVFVPVEVSNREAIEHYQNHHVKTKDSWYQKMQQPTN
jgi:hypothetical protein